MSENHFFANPQVSKGTRRCQRVTNE